MKNALKIFGFTVLVVAFYGYVGQMVPQQRTYPPEATQLSADMTTAEMVEMGEEIVGGKGTCQTCHTIGEEGLLRFPDLGNIGARAGQRREGYSDVEYLAESLYEPNAYVVEGFNPGMPQISGPPINLGDREILAVIAYLQSLGGTPTVTMQTELKYQQETPTTAAADDAAAAGAPTASPDQQVLDGETLFTTYLCNTCHSIDDPATLVGPSLFDVGSRLTRAEIYTSILEPDATIAEGFQAGQMAVTLEAVGFYDQVTTQELKALVDFLAAQQGG